jgi:hypothetical protein
VLASETPVESVFQIFREYYGKLGTIREIQRMQFNFPVNNLLFNISADSGRYILKRMLLADDFYGTENALERLELVSQVTDQLNTAGLPVEKIIANDSGRFVTPVGGDIIRVYAFIDGHPMDSRQPVQVESFLRSVKQLHDYRVQDLKISGTALTDILTAPYPLTRTVLAWRQIQEFYQTENHGAWKETWKELDTAAEAAKELLIWNEGMTKGLTHMDYHPRNVIFPGEKDAIMLDFDYLRVENFWPCLGLSLTRLIRHKGIELNSESLNYFAEVFYAGYSSALRDRSSFRKNLILGAAFAEVEKIFRNLYRVMVTGKYKKFADDVITLHFPIFRHLMLMIRSDSSLKPA